MIWWQAMIFFAAGGFICWSIFSQLYPKPKMPMADLFLLFQYIDQECGYDHDKIMLMREELWNWIDNPAANEDYLSNELQGLIKRATAVNTSDF